MGAMVAERAVIVVDRLVSIPSTVRAINSPSVDDAAESSGSLEANSESLKGLEYSTLRPPGKVISQVLEQNMFVDSIDVFFIGGMVLDNDLVMMVNNNK